MTTIHPELSRRIRISRIGAGGLEQAIEADADECRALALRMRIPAIASFTCRFCLQPAPHGQVAAQAELRAELTQVCVVSLEPFETTLREQFALRFVPAATGQDDIDPESPDQLPYDGDTIDLGETAAEQLALSLDPYPRMPGIALPAEQDAAADDVKANPFAALARREAS